jgi:4-amino-4-deoxy-L-arabinose transferase-like glycosyltransferase
MASLVEATGRDGQRQDRLIRWLVIFVILAGVALRVRGLFANGFHDDEALFAAWARTIAVWRDPLLMQQTVDKPPLLFYVQAVFYPLLATPAPWVARLPNLIASILVLPLTATLVYRIYKDQLALLVAVLFVAFSPLAIQFSATAFTDPLLTCLLVAAMVATVTAGTRSAAGLTSATRAAFFAGMLMGFAAATKHQAWLFLPLIVGLALLGRWRRRVWLAWVAGLFLVLTALLLWDVAQGDGISVWAAQLRSYGGLRLAWSWELWPRLESWAALWGMLVGSPVLAFLIVLALPAVLALIIYHQDWPTAYDQLFVLFLIAAGALHWFVAVPVWDRYLLPIVPLAGLLLGRFLARVLDFVEPGLPPLLARRLVSPLAVLALGLLLVPSAVAARAGKFPVGGSPRAGAGAAEIAATLAEAPYGTVLYDHWYSWQWRYYLFDSRVYVSWFPHAAALVEDLLAFAGDGPARYIALPQGAQAKPVARVVEEAGFRLEEVAAVGNIILYEVFAQ